jgi:heme a synthase
VKDETMTNVERPIHKSVPILATVLIGFTVVLLILGGATTSGRAGMADPVWPTEPWYLIENSQVFKEPRTGFLLEHTHRAAGWIVGALASALAITAWSVGGKITSRLIPLVSVVALLLCYGWLHGQMMVAQKRLNETGEMTWPIPTILTTAGCVVLLLASTVWHLIQKQRGAWVRALVTAVLIGVMIQGLLGGLRVLLDRQLGLKETLGIELSQWHGMFAQVLFSLMLLLPWVARPRKPGDALSSYDRSRLGWLGISLVLMVYLQLIWAVWVRHNPSGMAQRLHFLTAFVVAGIIVSLLVRILTSTDGRRLLGPAACLLLGLLTVQIALGVEAWLGKFAAMGPEAMITPTERKITTYVVVLRTAHQFVGACLFGLSVVLMYRLRRKPAATSPTVTE